VYVVVCGLRMCMYMHDVHVHMMYMYDVHVHMRRLYIITYT